MSKKREPVREERLIEGIDQEIYFFSVYNEKIGCIQSVFGINQQFINR